MSGWARSAGRLGTAAMTAALALAVIATAQVRGEDAQEDDQGPVIPLSDRFRPVYEGRIYRVKVNFHQPRRGGQPAPWIDARGWHAREIKRPIIFRLGDMVMVTGVFDYGDRSIFLELTRWPQEPWGEEPKRARVRVKTDAGPGEPGEQDEEIRLLVGLFLGRPSP